MNPLLKIANIDKVIRIYKNKNQTFFCFVFPFCFYRLGRLSKIYRAPRQVLSSGQTKTQVNASLEMRTCAGRQTWPDGLASPGCQVDASKTRVLKSHFSAALPACPYKKENNTETNLRRLALGGEKV